MYLMYLLNKNLLKNLLVINFKKLLNLLKNLNLIKKNKKILWKEKKDKWEGLGKKIKILKINVLSNFKLPRTFYVSSMLLLFN